MLCIKPINDGSVKKGLIYWCEDVGSNLLEINTPKGIVRLSRSRFEAMPEPLFKVDALTTIEDLIYKDDEYEVYGEDKDHYHVVTESYRLEPVSKVCFTKSNEVRESNVDMMEHYKGDIEPFDVYHSNGELLPFSRCCIQKYADRFGKKKGEEKKDIKKIIDYAMTLAYAAGITLNVQEIKHLVDYRIGWINERKRNVR
ncbi:MAG: DUF3310 domain-containing protein, partial [Fusobacteriaceae bacterium]